MKNLMPFANWDSLKILSSFKWISTYAWQQTISRAHSSVPPHLILALADHFEPYILPHNLGVYASRTEQLRRVKAWCQQYPTSFDSCRDSDGHTFRHTYFYPAEHYDSDIISLLAEHCRNGWGEIEIHLHHGMKVPDTAENTRNLLVGFRDRLVQHGCLSRLDDSGVPRYAFVHGNWALANSAGNHFCGVDSEMQILAETGCYADFTMPSAPNRGQVSKINALYECVGPLARRAPHRHGRDLARGRRPQVFPILVQGPLMLDFSRRKRRIFPALENSELSGANPPALQRLHLWQRAAITVQGCLEWLFVKLHCHGMDPRSTPALLGPPMQNFLHNLADAGRGGGFQTHFVTAREMTNLILAACDEKNGDPCMFRDYRLRPIK